jgi:DNA-binding transcriptional MerR regulator
MRPKKMYYSISEAAQMVGVKPYVLRYWETEFSALRPKAMKGGRRAYREGDLKTAMMIKRLLYEDRFTIEGARKRIQEMDKVEINQMAIPFEQAARETTLGEIRAGLAEVSEILSKALEGGKEEEF